MPRNGLIKEINKVLAVCAVSTGKEDLLAIATLDGKIRLWNPANGQHLKTLPGIDPVSVLCAVSGTDGMLLASAGPFEGTVKLQDPSTGYPVHAFPGVRGDTSFLHKPPKFGLDTLGLPVAAVCAITAGNQTLVATTSGDRTVRLWDAASGSALQEIPCHHKPTALAAAGDVLVIGLDCGLLVLKLNIHVLRGS